MTGSVEQYHIPRHQLDATVADEFLQDQLEELRDDVIRESGGHPDHEQDTAIAADILAKGMLLARRNDYAKEL